MKQYNWIKCLLLNVVTLGIYSLIMWVSTTKAHNTLADKYGTKRIMGFIPALLLGCITCGIFLIVWLFLYSKQEIELAAAKGVEISFKNTFLLTILQCFIPIYSFYLICDTHNKIVDGE